MILILYICAHFGDVAQLARALDWQSRGRGFDSHLLHEASTMGAIFMTYFVYIIYSASRDSYYVGSCDHMDKRLNDHNKGRSKSTQVGRPWELKYYETYVTRSEARKRESEVKRKKSRKYREWLVPACG